MKKIEMKHISKVVRRPETINLKTPTAEVVNNNALSLADLIDYVEFLERRVRGLEEKLKVKQNLTI